MGRVARRTAVNTEGDPTEDESSRQVGQEGRRPISLLSCPPDVRPPARCSSTGVKYLKQNRGEAEKKGRMKEREAGAFGKETQL